MIDILQGHEFEEWSKYLKYIQKREFLFDKYVFFFRAGFNILLHGVGSKKSLVSLFFKKYLKNQYLTSIINGYLPNINIKQVGNMFLMILKSIFVLLGFTNNLFMSRNKC